MSKTLGPLRCRQSGECLGRSPVSGLADEEAQISEGEGAHSLLDVEFAVITSYLPDSVSSILLSY